MAAFLAYGKGMALEEYLDQKIFSGMQGTTVMADPEEVQGYEIFTERYKKGLAVEKEAIRVMDWDEKN